MRCYVPSQQAEPPPPFKDGRKEAADKQFFQATFHWHHGELEEAHRLCSKAIEVFPKHKRAFLLRCEVRTKLGRWDEALEDGTAAIAMGHREGHRTRGAVHLERGKFRDAIADLNVAVRIEPSDRRAWGLRSRAHQGMGNTERAKEDAAEAERKDPDSEAGLCIVCLDEPRATRLNPCEHSALCAECARECQDHHGACPICNTTIKAIEYGTFLGTFAPSDTANFDNLASAIKKAREELVTLNARDGTAAAGTLGRIGEGSPLAATPNGGVAPSGGGGGGVQGAAGDGGGAERPATPPQERDYSEYTIGGDMNDLSGERSMPSTPAVLAGAFGDIGGVDGLSDLISPPGHLNDGNTPAGWSNMATVASPASAGSDRDSLRPERASAPTLASTPEMRPLENDDVEVGGEGRQAAGDGVGAPGTPPVADDLRPARASSPPALGGDGGAEEADESAEAASTEVEAARESSVGVVGEVEEALEANEETAPESVGAPTEGDAANPPESNPEEGEAVAESTLTDDVANQ